MSSDRIDPVVLGQRVRYARRRAGLTLDQLGERVGRPAPTLSLLENGHTEARLSLIAELADTLGCTLAELLEPTSPTRRDELELVLARAQEDPRYARLGLGHLRASAKVPDLVLEHLAALWDAYASTDAAGGDGPLDAARAANVALRKEMRERDNYYPEIEAAAAQAVAAAGYPGYGPLSERMLLDLVAHLGFTVDRVPRLVRSTRSITDLRNRVIYIPQRDELPTRAARSVVLSTIGHFVLGHRDPTAAADYLRQRVESNYFAGAVLAPEAAAVPFLQTAKVTGDLSAEDLKEVFYISYEMAAHRLTNLATRHLDLPMHFLRTDNEGLIWKAYENDGLPVPTAADGTIEGQRVPQQWAPRQAFGSDDTFSSYEQYTDTGDGVFWDTAHVETDRGNETVTLGTSADHARHFRGSTTTRRLTVSSVGQSSAVDAGVKRRTQRWQGAVWPSPRDRHHVIAGASSLGERFNPFPGVDMAEVYEFIDRQSQSGDRA